MPLRLPLPRRVARVRLTSRALRRRVAAAVAGLAVAVPVLVGAGQSGVAHAATSDVIASQGDPRGDVKLLSAPGPGMVARRSIDLRNVTVVDQPLGVRITVELKRILTKSKFDQIVEIQMKPADSAGTWFLDVTMSAQEPTLSTATYSADLSGSSTRCEPLLATVDPDADTVSLNVPDQCLPTDAAKIRVYSSLGNFTQSGPGFSLDKLRVRGKYLMQP